MINSIIRFTIVIAVRSIIVTWIIVTVSAIPVAMSHGIEEYYNHRNEINTACQFLSDEGYNHAAFQVSPNASSHLSTFNRMWNFRTIRTTSEHLIMTLTFFKLAQFWHKMIFSFVIERAVEWEKNEWIETRKSKLLECKKAHHISHIFHSSNRFHSSYHRTSFPWRSSLYFTLACWSDCGTVCLEAKCRLNRGEERNVWLEWSFSLCLVSWT